MKNILIKTLLILVPIISHPVLLAEPEWLDKVIVLVEDDVITDSEFKRRLKTIKQQILASNAELPDEAALKKQVLERLILDQIQLQMASRSGIRISDEELNEALNRVAESNKSTIALMKAQLEAEGMNFTLFREDIRNEMLISRLRQGAVSRKIFVSDQEVDDILVLMEGQGASNIQYHLRHFMVGIPESAGPNDVDKARNKIKKIVQRFNAGENFSQLVVAESEGSDALTSGDLGWRTIEQLPTLFADSISQLEAGQLSEPIRSANGLHLLKMEEIKGGIEKQMVDEVNLRHILIKLSTVTTDAKAEAVLIQMRKDIVAGKTTFEQQAKVYSEDLGTASQGGDLGWAPAQAFEPLYHGKAAILAEGELSQPFKGAEGWYLVEKLGTRETDQTEEVKRMRARRILQNRKFDEEQESWVREIREQAFVKILHEDKN